MAWILVCTPDGEFAYGTQEGAEVFRSPGWSTDFSLEDCTIVKAHPEFCQRLRAWFHKDFWSSPPAPAPAVPKCAAPELAPPLCSDEGVPPGPAPVEQLVAALDGDLAPPRRAPVVKAA